MDSRSSHYYAWKERIERFALILIGSVVCGLYTVVEMGGVTNRVFVVATNIVSIMAISAFAQMLTNRNRQAKEWHQAQRMMLEETVQIRTADLKKAITGLEKEIAVRRRIERLTTALYNISRAAQAPLSLNEYCQVIHQAIQTVVEAKNFFVALLDRGGNVIHFPYFMDEKDKYFEIPEADRSGSLTAEVIQSGAPLLLSENQIKARYGNMDRPPWGTMCRSWLGVPLRVRDEVIGAMGVQSYDQTDLYTPNDAEFLQSVATHIAVAIERRQAEEDLRLSEAMLRQIIDLVPHLIFAKNEEGRVLLANQAVAEAYGATVENLTGRIDREFPLKPEELDQFRAHDREVITTGRPKIIPEETLTDANGRARVLQTVKIPFTLAGSDEPAVLSVSIDITERKQADEALRLSEERYRRLYEESKRAEEVYRSLIHSSADAIMVVNMDGRVRYISPSFTQLFGYEESDILDRTVPILPEGADAQAEYVLKDVARTGAPCRGLETRRRTKDGRVLEISLSASRFDDHESRPAGVMMVLRDVTKTKELESQLRHAQKMEAVGTLASGIAHDFNNILQAISGYIQVMQSRRVGGVRGARYLGEIDHAVKRATELVRGLLTFGRKMEPERRVLDLNLEIQSALKLVERTIPKMIGIEVHPAGDLWKTEADPVQIEQILVNLFTNARDAMPNGGNIRLATDNVVLKPGVHDPGAPDLPPGRYVRLTFRDTGVGMDGETRERMFEPFYTTKKVGEGTGLGMFTVYGIIQALGGAITCRSEPGGGAEFTLLTPAVQPESSTETQAPKGLEPKPGVGRGRILVADDERAILDVAGEMLGEIGYEVLTASSGEEALARYQKERGRIDLVILDLGMPGMGGLQCLVELMAQNPGVRVLVSSGYSDNGLHQQVMDLGARGYVGKPYRLRDLIGAIQSVLAEENPAG